MNTVSQMRLQPTTAKSALDEWSSFIATHICPFEIQEVADSLFAVNAYCRSSNGFGLSCFDTWGGATKLIRSSRSIQRKAADFYAVYAPLEGSQYVTQFGRSRLCTPGTLTLVDPDESYCQQKLGNNKTAYFFIPKTVIEERLLDPQSACVATADFDSGAGLIARGFLHQMATQAMNVTERQYTELCKHLADLIALCYAGPSRSEDGPPALQLARRLQIKRHVRQNLMTPTLSPESIARNLGISVRHLYKIFSLEPVSLCEFIRQERLSVARRMLSDPAHSDQSITDIAYRCGFSSSAHFSSAFRTRFGISPRDCRV